MRQLVGAVLAAILSKYTTIQHGKSRSECTYIRGDESNADHVTQPKLQVAGLDFPNNGRVSAWGLKVGMSCVSGLCDSNVET